MTAVRRIWAYWDKGALSPFSQLCMLTWKKKNPGWDIELLSKDTWREYVPPSDLPNRFEELPPRLASDCLRLALLARYGGVWMDVSILLTKPLDSWCWNKMKPDSAFVFHHSAYDVQPRDFVESWFLAANSPHQRFFLLWRDRLRELLHDQTSATNLAATHPLYKKVNTESFDRLQKDFQAPFDFKEYLSIHAMYKSLHPEMSDDTAQWQFLDAATSAFRFDAPTMFGPPEKSLLRDESPLYKFTSPMQPNDLPTKFLLSPHTLVGTLFSDILTS